MQAQANFYGININQMEKLHSKLEDIISKMGIWITNLVSETIQTGDYAYCNRYNEPSEGIVTNVIGNSFFIGTERYYFRFAVKIIRDGETIFDNANVLWDKVIEEETLVKVNHNGVTTILEDKTSMEESEVVCVDTSCWAGSLGSKGYVNQLPLTKGKVYKLVDTNVVNSGYYNIIDDNGKEGIYPKSCFKNHLGEVLVK